MMTARLFSLILSIFAIASNAALLRHEDGPFETVPRFKRCWNCEDAQWRPPPYFYHYHHGPHFHSHQWSGMNRSPDGYQQQVFSGAAASADSDTQNSGGSQAFSLASSSAGSGNQYRNMGYKHSQNQGSYSDFGFGNKEASSENQGIDKQDVENQEQQKQVGFKQSDFINHGSSGNQGIDKQDVENQQQQKQVGFKQSDFINHGSSENQGIDKQDVENQEQQKQVGFKQSDFINHGSSGNQGIDKQDVENQQQQKQVGFKQSDFINHGSSGNQGIDKQDVENQEQQKQVGFKQSDFINHGYSGNQGIDKQDVENQQQQKQVGFKQSHSINHGSGAGFGENVDSSNSSAAFQPLSGTQAINKPDSGIQQQQQQFNHGSYSGAGFGNKENVPAQTFGTQRFDKEDAGNQQQQKQFGFKQPDRIDNGSGAGHGGNIDRSSASSGTQAPNKHDFGIQQQQQQFNHGLYTGAGFGNKENVPSQTFVTQGFDKEDAGNRHQQKQFGFKQPDCIDNGSGANIDSSSASSDTQLTNKPNFGIQQQQQQQQQFNHGSSGSRHGNKENTASHTYGPQEFDKEDIGNQQQQKEFGFKQSDYINHGSGPGFGDKIDSSIASSGNQAINKPDFGTQLQQQKFNHESYSGERPDNKENAPTQTLGNQVFDKQNLGTQQQFGFKHSQNSGVGYNSGGNSGSSSQRSTGIESIGKEDLDNQQQQIGGPSSKDSWETIRNPGNLNPSSSFNNGNLQSQISKFNGLQSSGNEQQQLNIGGNSHKDFSGSDLTSEKSDKNTNNLQSTEGYGYGWFAANQNGQTEGKTGSQINHKTLENGNSKFGPDKDKIVDSSLAGSEQRPTSFGSGSFQSAHNTNQNLNKNYHTGSLANHESLNDEQQTQQHDTESFGQNQFQSYDNTKSSLSGALSLASQGLQASENSNTGCSTCSGKESIAYSNAKSHSGSAIALAFGGK